MRLRGVLVGILVFLLVTFGESMENKASKIEKVTFTTSQLHNMSVIPYELGIKKGLYKKEGIELEYLLMKGSLAVIGLKTGEIGYATSSTSMTITSAMAGFPIKVIMVVRTKSGLFLVARPGINSVKDLKGKVIGGGSSIGGTTDYAVRAILRYHGLDPNNDVIIRQTAGDIKMTVLLTGSVDAGIMNIIEGILLEKKGFKILMSADETMRGVSIPILVSAKKIREEPIQIKKVIRGTLKAIEYIRRNRQEVIDFMIKEWGLDKELASAVYDREKDDYTLNGMAPDENFHQEIKQARERGLLPPDLKLPPAQQLRDFTVLEEVLKEMGIR